MGTCQTSSICSQSEIMVAQSKMPTEGLESEFQFATYPDVEDELTEMRLRQQLECFGENAVDTRVSDIICSESRYYISSHNGQLQSFDLKFNPVANVRQKGTCNCLGFSSDQLLAHEGMFDSHSIIFYHKDSLMPVAQVLVGQEPVWKIRSIDSANYILCHGDGSIGLWNQQKLLKTSKHHDGAIFDAMLVNNKLVTASQDESVKIFDYKSEKVDLSIKEDDIPYCLGYLRDNIICYGTGSGYLKTANMVTGMILTQVQVHKGYISRYRQCDKQSISVISTFYAATTSGDRLAKVVRIQDGKLFNKFEKSTEYQNDSEPLLYRDKVLILGDWNSVQIQQ